MSRPLTPSTTDVVLLCGGRGTRLGALTAAVPKPLLPAGDRPFLTHLLDRLQQEGFRRFVLAAHYLAEAVQQFAHEHANIDLTVVIEPEPLGTGGALRHAMRAVRSPQCVALNADSWVTQPLAPVLEQHGREATALTMVAVEASQVEGGAAGKGRLQLGAHGELLGLSTGSALDGGLVNAGIYVIDTAWAAGWPDGRYDLEAMLPSLIRGQAAGVFRSAGQLLDIGTPACYELVAHGAVR